MKSILLPTDFSTNAWNAISYALQLFKDEDCTFHVLHTYTPSLQRVDYAVGGPVYSGIPDPLVDKALDGVEKTLLKIEENYSNPRHQFVTHTKFSLLVDEIKEITSKHHVDLVVMGTQGATGARRVFFGSNTVAVINKTEVPVLAVPLDYKNRPLRQLLFVTDFLQNFNNDSIKILLHVIEKTKPQITLLHITDGVHALNSKQIQHKRQLEELFDRYSGNEVINLEFQGSMPDSLFDFVKQSDYQLLAMINRKHSVLERLIRNQNIDQIGFETNLPFLVIPPIG
ncbi:universal stress protein [Spongiivirga sp. MCCC 1A20706]|uniref:universal stress protein n=1 Tax=Spongiivirga sp. MCCC 1A20706 TaxID=3160963 RepID=UPI00397773EE